MTLNLTELRDEPLGKHPFQAAMCVPPCGYCYSHNDLAETEQEAGAAADTHSSTFSVFGLSDEALDGTPRGAFICAGFVCRVV